MKGVIIRRERTGKPCTCLVLPCECGSVRWRFIGKGEPGERTVNVRAKEKARLHRKRLRNKKRRR